MIMNSLAWGPKTSAVSVRTVSSPVLHTVLRLAWIVSSLPRGKEPVFFMTWLPKSVTALVLLLQMVHLPTWGSTGAQLEEKRTFPRTSRTGWVCSVLLLTIIYLCAWKWAFYFEKQLHLEDYTSPIMALWICLVAVRACCTNVDEVKKVMFGWKIWTLAPSSPPRSVGLYLHMLAFSNWTFIGTSYLSDCTTFFTFPASGWPHEIVTSGRTWSLVRFFFFSSWVSWVGCHGVTWPNFVATCRHGAASVVSRNIPRFCSCSWRCRPLPPPESKLPRTGSIRKEIFVIVLPRLAHSGAGSISFAWLEYFWLYLHLALLDRSFA